MVRRDRIEIVASLLEIACIENRVGITKLMYFSFLSYPQVKSYLQILMKENHMEYDKLDKSYKITAKGQRFLGVLNEINEMLKPISSQVTDAMGDNKCR